MTEVVLLSLQEFVGLSWTEVGVVALASVVAGAAMFVLAGVVAGVLEALTR